MDCTYTDDINNIALPALKTRPCYPITESSIRVKNVLNLPKRIFNLRFSYKKVHL